MINLIKMRFKRKKPQVTTENKKVRNATAVVIDGIKFRSKLEAYCYERLKEEGFPSSYESSRVVLMEGFTPSENFFIYVPKIIKGKKGPIERATGKIRDITMTPDFMFEYKGYDIIIETKGNPNDAYPNKRKTYFKLLNEKIQDKRIAFFEPSSKKHVDEVINILKEL